MQDGGHGFSCFLVAASCFLMFVPTRHLSRSASRATLAAWPSSVHSAIRKNDAVSASVSAFCAKAGTMSASAPMASITA